MSHEEDTLRCRGEPSNEGLCVEDIDADDAERMKRKVDHDAEGKCRRNEVMADDVADADVRR